MPVTSPQGTLDFKKVDKITFVGASSNTVIDTTTGSVGIGVVGDALSSNLHVVGDTRMEGNINMLHTSNTASIKLNSNVVTEFPRSKKLIKYPRVALTAASGESSGYQGYYVTESSNSSNTNRPSWKAFDMTFATDTSDDGWATNANDDYGGSGSTYQGSSNLGTGAVDGEWIKLQLPHKIKLEYMKIWLKDNDPTRIPENWILYGSDDNTNWTQLFSKIGQGAVHENTYNVNANSMYNYLAVVVTKIAVQTNYFRIMELEYFGTPEYDPEAHGTDVVVKSEANVPNTDWLEVYYDAKGLPTGAVTNPISGLEGTTNNGTAYGGVTVSDGAFVLDGTNDYIKTSALGFSGDQVHSVSLWFWSDKPHSDMTTEHGLYCIGRSTNPLNGTNSARGGLSFWSPVSSPDNPMRYWHSQNHGVNFKGTRIASNTWNHVIVVYPGDGVSNVRIWLNGVEQRGVYAGSTNNDFAWDTNDHILIGDWYTGTGAVNLESPWDGKIANFRLFNRALTTDEVWQLYAYQKEYFGRGDLSMTLKAGRLGIGTSEPRAGLDVWGNVNVDGVPVLGRPAFYAELDNATSRYEGPGVAVFNDVIYNRGSCYSGSTGLFTAPFTGAYKFHCYGYARGNGQNWWVRPVLNGSYWARGPYSTTAGAADWIIPMNVGDTVGMYIPTNSYAFYLGGDRHNGFSGYLIG